MRTYYVYIITNKHRTTFYIGVTNNLENRIWAHRTKFNKGFSGKYRLRDLVYYEEFEHIIMAIDREKQLKRWHREWKLNLIRTANPDMKNLAAEWFD